VISSSSVEMTLCRDVGSMEATASSPFEPSGGGVMTPPGAVLASFRGLLSGCAFCLRFADLDFAMM
jgi:hypothetical protein